MLGRRKFRPTADQQIVRGDELRIGDYIHDFHRPGKGVAPGDEATVVDIHHYELGGRPMLGVAGDWLPDPSGEQWEWTIAPDEPVLIRKR